MSARRRIRAIKVHQWLPEWDQVSFDVKHRRRRPEPQFYLFSVRASHLKALSGISRRSTQEGSRRSEDIGIQRRHDSERSQKIAEFVRYGYPWSELKLAQRSSGDFADLQKPGWLPTAIVINILQAGDKRRGKSVSAADLIKVAESAEGGVDIVLPTNFEGSSWLPAQLHPIEVIDGQHRLWAFEDNLAGGDFELPVVAFLGLDISWQAYLFWTINITPKKINASLAFDLYPLLRMEDWLEKFEGPSVYRETRAQELTENIWAHTESPWHDRINMLGEPGLKGVLVTQAAWIRSLMATYIKAWEGKRISIGGLFGAPIGQHETVLPWSRTQQASFLIFVWQDLQRIIQFADEPWAKALRGRRISNLDEAFAGPYTLLNTDQGVRGVLYVSNDLCFLEAGNLGLADWAEEQVEASPSNDSISRHLDNIREMPVANFVSAFNGALAKFDWRTSAAPGLSEEDRIKKAAFRGSGGYKEIRRQLLKAVAAEGGIAASVARKALGILGY